MADQATHGPILDVKAPTKAEIKKWQPVVEMCTKMILLSDVRHGMAYFRDKVTIVFPNTSKPFPPNFPIGRVISKDKKRIVKEYNPIAVLLYLYQRKYCTHSPGMLFKSRSYTMFSLSLMENELDKMFNLGDNMFIDSDFTGEN